MPCVDARRRNNSARCLQSSVSTINTNGYGMRASIDLCIHLFMNKDCGVVDWR